MNKVKVILFGDLPISTKVCKYLIDNDQIDLLGVVIGNNEPKNNDPWDDVPFLEEYVSETGLKKYCLNDLTKNFERESLDYGISCRFSRILKNEHIQLFKKGIINFHGGLLPEFGGLYSACHTILEGSPIGGGTIHFINEGIDSGHIIKRCEFNVSPKDTANTIFKKTQIALYQGFVEVFQNLINGDVQPIAQDDYIKKGYPKRYFNKASLDGKKQFYLNDSEKEIDCRVRAFEYPGHQPAFFKIGEEKYFVRKQEPSNFK